jgi:hypothetical protein
MSRYSKKRRAHKLKLAIFEKGTTNALEEVPGRVCGVYTPPVIHGNVEGTENDDEE